MFPSYVDKAIENLKFYPSEKHKDAIRYWDAIYDGRTVGQGAKVGIEQGQLQDADITDWLAKVCYAMQIFGLKLDTVAQSGE